MPFINLTIMEALIALLDAVHPLSPALLAHLRSKIKRYTYKKGTNIVKAGEVASLILFLEKGLIRSYSIVNEKRASNYFMREGDIIISVISFFMQVPASDSIEALQDCVAWGISFEELEEIYALFPEFNIHGRRISNLYYCRAEKRWQSQHRKTPEEKYAWLMEEDAELVSRVKDSYIASYLDVSKTTFYTIKRDYAQRRRS